MNRRIFSLKTFLIMAVAVLLLSPCAVLAIEEVLPAPKGLLEIYARIRPQLESNSFGVPLAVESSEVADRIQVDVYGLFDQPITGIADTLSNPDEWCDIVFLHPNVKACTYRQEASGPWQLTFYLGRKFFQPPEDSRQVTYRYQIVDRQPSHLDIRLNAEEGPFGTQDHRMRFEAVPVGGDRTLAHVSYSYQTGDALRLAENIYFATLGRDKIGFTVIGTDPDDGSPVYIKGRRGALERNAVRYYCAIQAFIGTLNQPETSRLAERIGQWYKLTDRFRKQLFIQEKSDYISMKTKEHAAQEAIQRKTSAEKP